jgi:hypothetical protein
VQCAAQIQQTLAETPIIVGDGSICVRIGLHTGTPIVYPDDVSGRTDLSGTDVDKAARVESIARGGQVLISEQTHMLTDRIAVRDWGFWDLKGLGGERIFEVLYPGNIRKPPRGVCASSRSALPHRSSAASGKFQNLWKSSSTIGWLRSPASTEIGKTRLADFAARRVSVTSLTGLLRRIGWDGRFQGRSRLQTNCGPGDQAVWV